MNTQIVIAGLRARPVRTAVGVLSVTLEVVLILLLVGATNGAIDDTGKRVAGVGAEIVIKDADSSYIMGMSSAVLPIKELTDIVLPVEGVAAVAPVIAQTDGGFTVVSGIERSSFDAVSGGFKILDGEWFSGGYEAMVDEWQAKKKNIRIGDTVQILKEDFKITGIVEPGKMSRIFIPILTLQKKQVKEGFASILYVKLKKDVDAAAAVKRIEAELKGTKFEVLEARDWVGMMFTSNADLINNVFRIVVVLGVTIGVLVIFLSMYTSVTERTREIGILRSMGASKGFIVSLVLLESLVLCAIGAVVGVGMSELLVVIIKKFMPTTSMLITGDWIVRAVIFALVSGLIGCLYPAYKAASQDPIEALAYE